MSRLRRTVVWIGCCVACVWCAAALADNDPGDRAFTALGGGRLGQSASVGATGNLGLSLPLQFPSPRGGLPLPLAVSYNGSHAVGAAGVGWDIPLLGVTRQRNLSRRKPVHYTRAGAPAAEGDPVAYYVPTDGTHHMIYRGRNGHLHEMWWTSETPPMHANLTALADAAPAAGDPVAYFVPSEGMHHVIYRTNDGHVRQLWWLTGGTPGEEDLMPADAAPAAGDPVAYFVPSEGMHHVIYRTNDGHVRQLWWLTGGTPGEEDLMPADAAPAAGDPVAYFVPSESMHHVIYRRSNGHLHELWWLTGGTPGERFFTFTSDPRDARPADRILLDVGSGPMLMAPTTTAGVYQPFGNGY